MADLTGSRRRQRLVVLVAFAVFAAAIALWPQTGDRAEANSQSNSYEPYQCQTPGSGSGTGPQQRRQNLTLDNGSGGFNATGHVFPCVSGVLWDFTVGDVTSSSSTSVGSISKVYAQQAPQMYFAAGGSRTDLYQVAFSSLVFNTTTTGIVMDAKSANTYAEPKPAAPYTLSISPDGPVTIGGSGVTTEIWATGDSSFTVPASQLPCIGIKIGSTCVGLGGTTLCAAVGTTHGSNCQIKLSTFGSDLVQLLAAGGNWTLIGLDLHFYYLVTHGTNPSDPYTQPPTDSSGNPLNSIQLPNTTIAVS